MRKSTFTPEQILQALRQIESKARRRRRRSATVRQPRALVSQPNERWAAVVVGGTSLAGGRGTISGTLCGTLFIGVRTNGLNLAGIDPYVQKIAVSAVILIAATSDRFMGRAEGGRARATAD